MILVAQTSDVANTSYLWVYVLIGVITIAGFVIAAAKWLRKQGARDAKLDALIDPENGVLARLAVIEKNLRPNGKNTQGVGDIVARLEEGMAKLGSKLDRHIGTSDQIHRDLRDDLNRKEDKERA